MDQRGASTLAWKNRGVRRAIGGALLLLSSLLLIGCNDSGEGTPPTVDPDVNPSPTATPTAPPTPVAAKSTQILLDAAQENGGTIVYRAVVNTLPMVVNGGGAKSVTHGAPQHAAKAAPSAADFNQTLLLPGVPGSAKKIGKFGVKLSLAAPVPEHGAAAFDAGVSTSADVAMSSTLADVAQLPFSHNTETPTFDLLTNATTFGELVISDSQPLIVGDVTRDDIRIPGTTFYALSPAPEAPSGTVVLRNRPTAGVKFDPIRDQFVFTEKQTDGFALVRRTLSGDEQHTPLSGARFVIGAGVALDIGAHRIINTTDFSTQSIDDMDSGASTLGAQMLQRADGSAWLLYVATNGAFMLRDVAAAQSYPLSDALTVDHGYRAIGFITPNLFAYRVALRELTPEKKTRQHTQIRVFDVTTHTAQTLVDFETPSQWMPELAATPLYLINGVYGKVGERYVVTAAECHFAPTAPPKKSKQDALYAIDPSCDESEGTNAAYLLAWLNPNGAISIITAADHPTFLLQFFADAQLALMQDANGVRAINVRDGQNAHAVSLAGAARVATNMAAYKDPANWDRISALCLMAQSDFPFVIVDQSAQHALGLIGAAQISADAITPLSLGNYSGTVHELHVVPLSSVARDKPFAEDTTAPLPTPSVSATSCGAAGEQACAPPPTPSIPTPVPTSSVVTCAASEVLLDGKCITPPPNNVLPPHIIGLNASYQFDANVLSTMLFAIEGDEPLDIKTSCTDGTGITAHVTHADAATGAYTKKYSGYVAFIAKSNTECNLTASDNGGQTTKKFSLAVTAQGAPIVIKNTEGPWSGAASSEVTLPNLFVQTTAGIHAIKVTCVPAVLVHYGTSFDNFTPNLKKQLTFDIKIPLKSQPEDCTLTVTDANGATLSAPFHVDVAAAAPVASQAKLIEENFDFNKPMYIVAADWASTLEKDPKFFEGSVKLGVSGAVKPQLSVIDADGVASVAITKCTATGNGVQWVPQAQSALEEHVEPDGTKYYSIDLYILYKQQPGLPRPTGTESCTVTETSKKGGTISRELTLQWPPANVKATIAPANFDVNHPLVIELKKYDLWYGVLKVHDSNESDPAAQNLQTPQLDIVDSEGITDASMACTSPSNLQLTLQNLKKNSAGHYTMELTYKGANIIGIGASVQCKVTVEDNHADVTTKEFTAMFAPAP